MSNAAKNKLVDALRKKSPKKFAEGGDSVPDQGAPTDVPLPPEDNTPIPPRTAANTTPAPPEDTVTVTGQQPQPMAMPTAADNLMQRNAESMAFADDLNNGRVKPQTYQDLFDSKDTPGKIGTLFGLLISGAGSGLTHQPNAVMEMMNNEINRDLDAQKTNQTNKQNWYKLAMEHEMNQANIGNLQASTAATQAGIPGIAARSNREIWTNDKFGILDQGAVATAQNGMLMSQTQTMQDNINRMAPGPARVAAQNTLDSFIKPQVMKQVVANNAQWSTKKALVDQAVPPKPIAQVPNDPVSDRGTYNAALNKGKLAASLAPQLSGLPDAITPEENAKITPEIERRSLNRQDLANYEQSFNRIKNLPFAGEVPGAGVAGHVKYLGQAVGAAEELSNFTLQRNREIDATKARLSKTTNLNPEQLDSFIEHMYPKFNDTEESRRNAFQHGIQYFKAQEPRQKVDEINDRVQAATGKSFLSPFPNVPYPTGGDENKPPFPGLGKNDETEEKAVIRPRKKHP